MENILTNDDKYYLACLSLNKDAFNIWQGYAPDIYNKDIETPLKRAFGENNFDKFNLDELEKCKSKITTNPSISVKLKDIFPESIQKIFNTLLIESINKKLKKIDSSLEIDTIKYTDTIKFTNKDITFLNGTFIEGKVFYTSLVFKNCTFNDILMSDVEFKNKRRKKGKQTNNRRIEFHRCTFNNFKANRVVFGMTTIFDYSIFKKGITVYDTIFKEKANFAKVVFNGNESKFELVLFEKSPNFRDTFFNSSKNTTFKYSYFYDVSFANTIFKYDVSFRSSAFIGEAKFHNTKFYGESRFDTVRKTKHKKYLLGYIKNNYKDYNDNLNKFIEIVENKVFDHINKIEGQISFHESIFKKTFSFDRRVLEDSVSFEACEFQAIPRFYSLENIEFLNLSNCKFYYKYEKDRFKQAQTESIKKDISIQAITNIRNLQKVSEATKNRDLLRELFLLELDIKNKLYYKSNIVNWFKIMGLKSINFFYKIFSRGGRSMLIPLFWIIMLLMISLIFNYSMLNDKIAKAIVKTDKISVYKTNIPIIKIKIDDNTSKLAYYTVSNLLPISTNKKRLLEMEKIFDSNNYNKIYWYIIFEKILGSLFIFLLMFSIRNYFKM